MGVKLQASMKTSRVGEREACRPLRKQSGTLDSLEDPARHHLVGMPLMDDDPALSRKSFSTYEGHTVQANNDTSDVQDDNGFSASG